MITRQLTRCLSVAQAHPSRASLPWYVDHATTPVLIREPPPHLLERVNAPAPVPEHAPGHLKALHVQLSQSPHLEPSSLVVCEPVPREWGPPLPDAMPKGRRKRGRTNAGEGVADESGGIWSWFVMAQVKEGTENRGAIESVVRVVRKTLLGMQPPIALAPNSKRRLHNGWAMIDAGNFAVHVLSKDARQKYFDE